MKKYVVSGKVAAFISVEVEAENEEEAISMAYEECSGPSSYVGNGGCDKLIGVYGSNVSIACDDEIEYTKVEEIK